MLISYLLITIVAALHIWFAVLEMFLWTKSATIKKFGITKEFAEASAGLAANQGLYNLFLVAGLVFALFNHRADYFMTVSTFVLTCIVVAGVFGGVTVNRKIFFLQALPAAIGLLALWSGV